MSVTPTNPDLELLPADASSVASTIASETQTDSYGRSALEALLAFSALHQEVRERRLQEHGDSWHLEQFVLDEVFHLVAERAVAITGAAGVAIALAEHNAIVCRASAGIIAPDHGMSVDLNSGFSGACLTSGQIVRCDDTETDPRVDAPACRKLGARSMVAVPLSAKGSVVGLIEGFSCEPYGFDDSDVRSLNLLAELILSAMRPEEEHQFAELSRDIVGRKHETAIPSDTFPSPEVVPSEVVRDSDTVAGIPPPEGIPDSRPGLGIVMTVILVALALGAGLWWRMRASDAKATSNPSTAPTTQAAKAAPQNAVMPHPEPTIAEDQISATPATAAQVANLPEVTGIRHWSSADSSSVVIDLQDQVQYEAHRLSDPDRIYFDLHETRLPPELFGKNFDIGDSLIQRVRVAQPIPGVTRIVLETKGASNFSVSLEINPYRLVVELTKIGAKPQARLRFNLFKPLQESASVPATPRPLAPKLRIVLDAGHGGWDLGTVGRRGLMEKDLALDIVSRLGKLVEHRLGAEVIFTRADDSYVALEKRTEIANLAQADLFVSVHANYSDYPSARGVETYYSNTYSSLKARSAEDQQPESVPQNVNWTNVDIQHKVRESHRLAASVQHALYSTLAKKNPGLPNRGVKRAQYFVLAGTTMPSVLAEISFVSSPADEDNLQNASYRQHVAEALYEGLAHYAEKVATVKLASAGKPITN
ncbi:MAG: N-acetylmuramoyl-L-alanine amidase [Acidobacteriaceae bacterium]|nr:N-acetylmuramoyl-L-alanine amidase [Acidobacteriaceae bacterium]